MRGEDHNGTGYLAAFELIVQQQSQDETQNGGQYNHQNGPDHGVFQNHGKLGTADNFLKVLQSNESLHQTGLGNLAECHTEDKADGDNNENEH